MPEGFGFKRTAPQPVVRPGDTLISKADLYGPNENVLLLKEGREIPAELLPTLVKLGVDPKQLAPARPNTPEPTERQTLSAPEDFSPSRGSRLLRASQRVMIAESNHRHIERLTNCLVVCGFNLSRIHPVRTENALNWALNKYRPDVLVFDYAMGYEWLSDVAKNPPEGLSRIIMTLTLEDGMAQTEKDIARACDAAGIGLLPKPANRFALNKLLP